MKIGGAARWAVAGAAAFGILTLSDFIGWTDVHLVTINTTPSIATGIYLRTFETPAVGRVVRFPLPPAMADYLSAYPKAAEFFRFHALLKPVVAGPGDLVCMDDARMFSVDGSRLGRAERLDPHGRPLPTWTGCRRLADEVAVFTDHIAYSFDSRYYGPVALSDVAVYRLLWGFE